jgi:hypothetical protein
MEKWEFLLQFYTSCILDFRSFIDSSVSSEVLYKLIIFCSQDLLLYTKSFTAFFVKYFSTELLVSGKHVYFMLKSLLEYVSALSVDTKSELINLHNKINLTMCKLYHTRKKEVRVLIIIYMRIILLTGKISYV